MAQHRISHTMAGMTMWAFLLTGLAVTLSVGTPLLAAEMPPEMPLWEGGPPAHAFELDAKEQVRSLEAQPGSPSGLNRVYSSVSMPTYSIHRPANPNGVGLVICPGGGFLDVWIDVNGHDLAIWLEDYNVTSLVLKYRTRPNHLSSPDAWQSYQRSVQSDGRRAIRILRKQADDLNLQSNKIGICGFSAGGHLAISCALFGEPKSTETTTSGMADFAGLFYPGIPDGASQVIESRSAPQSAAPGICPMFIVNARDDDVTPVNKCVEFYAQLLRAGVNAELHVFNKGSHGFNMGQGRGYSTALWPMSFAAWLRDAGIIE